MGRRSFSREFKLEAVRLVRERGVSVAQAARDLDLHQNMLRNWVREFAADPAQAFPGQGQMKPEQAEIERLRREVAEAEGRTRHPKKSRRLLREGPDVMFGFVAKHRGIWPVAFLCEALGVSRSGFYAWLTRGPSARSRRDEVLSAKIKSSFQDSDRTYGARRVWHDLLAAGIECGLHAIERLMRRNGLRARPRRRRLPIDIGDRPAAATLGERARPPLRGAGAQPQMGGRLHLHLDGRGLAVCGGRARPVLAQSGRLVDERGNDRRARHRRAGDGDLAARPAERAAASFRSRQPVYERGVPAADGRARGDVQPQPLGQRLGQRGDGELLLLPQGRARGTQDLPHEGPGQSRRVRLHREVLQSATEALYPNSRHDGDGPKHLRFVQSADIGIPLKPQTACNHSVRHISINPDF